MVSTKNVITCGTLNISGQNVSHVQCWQRMMSSMIHCSNQGESLWILDAARETKPDCLLVKHNMLHVMIEYSVSFSEKLKTPTCKT